MSSDPWAVHCFPNPFRPLEGQSVVTFVNLPDHSHITVHDITGRLVYDREASTPGGRFVWGPVNQSGRPLNSGVYIYHITGRYGASATGTLAIIR